MSTAQQENTAVGLAYGLATFGLYGPTPPQAGPRHG
jgi:hypothetical protein